MITPRQFRIQRAALKVLLNCGSYMLPDAILRDEVGLLLSPAPTSAELDEAIKRIDTDRLITGVQADAGLKWKIADGGRAWLAENP